MEPEHRDYTIDTWSRPLTYFGIFSVGILIAIPFFSSAYVSWWSNALSGIAPILLGLFALLLALWAFFTLLPPLIRMTTRAIAERFPPTEEELRGGVRLGIQGATAVLLPVGIYTALMSLARATASSIPLAVGVGAVVGLVWMLMLRTVQLAKIALAIYPEDELRKELQRSGRFDAQKLEAAQAQIRRELNPDIQRVRLRRMDKLVQTLANRNLDPRKDQEEPLVGTTVADLKREREIARAKGKLHRDTLKYEAKTEEQRSRVAYEKAQQRAFAPKEAKARSKKDVKAHFTDYVRNGMKVDKAAAETYEDFKSAFEKQGHSGEKLRRYLSRVEALIEDSRQEFME